MSDVTTCLYCPATSEKPFSKAEHVLPKSFGKFESREGNLTLHNVCSECNAYFGRHLEQHFGRDTLDAYFRLLSGVNQRRRQPRSEGVALPSRSTSREPSFTGLG
jgi:hypothetical protein